MANVLKDSVLKTSARQEQKNLVKSMYVHKGLQPFLDVNESYENRMINSLKKYSSGEMGEIKKIKDNLLGTSEPLDRLKYFCQQLILYKNSDNLEIAEKILNKTEDFITRGEDPVIQLSGIINYYMSPRYLDYSKINQSKKGRRKTKTANIASIVDSWYEGWENIFSENNIDDPNIIMNNDEYNKVLDDYNKLIQELDNKIDNTKDILVKEELKQILKFFLERGYAYISKITVKDQKNGENNNTNKNAEIFLSDNQKLTNYKGQIKDIKEKGNKRRVHYSPEKREGSFTATIRTNTSVALGLLREKLSAQELKLKAKADSKNVTWETKMTGSKSIYVKGDYKTRVTDLEVKIPSLYIEEKKEGKKLRRGENIQTFNISLKNYKEKSDITGSTSANISNYAKSLRMNDVNPQITNILEGKEIAYFLLNEQKWNPQGAFLNGLVSVFEDLGLFVSFSLFMPLGAMKEGKGKIDNISDRIDFLMVNGMLVPSFLIIKDFISSYGKENFNVSVTIRNVYNMKSDIVDDIQNTTEKKKISYKKRPDKTNLYRKNYLQLTYDENQKLYSKASITTHITKKYRTTMIEKIAQAKNRFEDELNTLLNQEVNNG